MRFIIIQIFLYLQLSFSATRTHPLLAYVQIYQILLLLYSYFVINLEDSRILQKSLCYFYFDPPTYFAADRFYRDIYCREQKRWVVDHQPIFIMIQMEELYQKLQQMTNPRLNFRNYLKSQMTEFTIFEEEEDQSQQQIHQSNNQQSINPSLSNCSIAEEHISSSSKQENAKDSKTSVSHNFQKHAVVTIKKLMRFKYDYNGTQSQKLAHLMWNIFMASKVKNKKMLVILFGVASLKDQNYVKMMKKCGFEEILEYGQSLVRQSQEILRVRFNDSVTEELVHQNLSNCRNIKLTQQFFIYFSELLKQIKAGPLLKLRMNDKIAKKIQKIIKGE